MSTTIILVALILCTTASSALEKAPLVRHLTISTANSSTVPFNGHLYTIAKSQSHIHVNSSDSNHHPCDIEIVDPSRDVIRDRFEVTATDKEIFIVGVKSISENEQYKYTILRVDPKACTYQAADIPETSDRRGLYFLPRLARRSAGIDVFFPDLKKCAPCRLGSSGLRDTGTVPQIPQETYRAGTPFHVRYVESANSYFYVYNVATILAHVEEAWLKLLDSNNFSKTKERSIKLPVHAVSAKESSNGDLAICSKIREDVLAPTSTYIEVRCDRLNSTLDTVNTARIPLGPDYKPVSKISYEFDKEGNSYIGMAEDTKLRLYIHDKDGKLVKALDLGEVDERFTQYGDVDTEFFFNPHDYWDVRGYLVGNEYCVITDRESMDSAVPFHDVKCFDVKK